MLCYKPTEGVSFITQPEVITQVCIDIFMGGLRVSACVELPVWLTLT